MTNDLFPSVDTSGQSDIDVEWFNCRFGQDPKYKVTDKDGKTYMPVVLRYDQRDENGVVREDQVLTIGNGFKVVDGGARVVAENERFNTGPTAGLSRNSKASELLDTLVPLDVAAFTAKLEAGSGPRDASFWGIKFHLIWDERPFGKPDIETGQRKTFQVPTASKFYGWVDGDGGDGVAAGSDAGDDAATTSTVDLSVLTDDVKAKLVTIAKASSNFGDFISEAYKLDEIADEAVQGIVEDEAGFKALKAS